MSLTRNSSGKDVNITLSTITNNEHNIKYPIKSTKNLQVIDKPNIPLLTNSNNVILNKPRFFLANKLQMGKTLRSNLKNNFEKSENYLTEIPNVIIGRIPKGPKDDGTNNKQIKSYSVVGGPKIIAEIYKKRKHQFHHIASRAPSIVEKSIGTNKSKATNTNNINHLSIQHTHSINSNDTNSFNINNLKTKIHGQHTNKNEKASHLEYVDDKKINLIYEKYRNIIKENNLVSQSYNVSNKYSNNLNTNPSSFLTYDKLNNNLGVKNTNNAINIQSTDLHSPSDKIYSTKQKDFMNNFFNTGNSKFKINHNNSEIPPEVQHSLNFQEKTLRLQNENSCKRKNMENFLEKKLNKSNDQLLINSGESYLIKKEIINLVESKIPLDQKHGIFNWIISLRRPKNFKGDRYAYVNLGDNYAPVWQLYKESSPIKIDKVVNPGTENKDYREYVNLLKNNSSILNKNATSEIVNEIEDLNKNEVRIIKFI